LALTKPRVVSLIVFTAMIGMFLATPGVVALQPFLFGVIGIALVAGSAAAVNCLLEQKIDALMNRTRARPLPRGQLTSAEALAFAAVVGTVGLALLYSLVNPLTAWLALATFVGYAFVYTVILKPRNRATIPLVPPCRRRTKPRCTRFLDPFGGYRAFHRNPIVRVHFMNPTHTSHNMPGRFWVGVLIGLAIVALVFGLT